MILLFCFPLGLLEAQNSKRIEGNGTLAEDIRLVGMFSELEITTAAEVRVVCQQMPQVVIEGDANLLPRVKTQLIGNRLIISAEGWIAPTLPLRIEVHTSFLSKLMPGGWTTTVLENLDTPDFYLEAEVGKVILNGSCERLQINSHLAEVEAQKLESREAKVQITGRGGKVKLGPTFSIQAELHPESSLAYSGKPNIENPKAQGQIYPIGTKPEEEKVAVARIACTLHNPKMRVINFRIEGPPQARFGYGAQIGPLGSKKEHFPIGTRLYRKNKEGEEILIVEIRKEDAGRKIRLW